MINWQTRKDMYDQLVRHEGKRLKPYRCTAGYLTIGVGRNLEANGISELEAELMCLNDIDQCQKQLDKHLYWWRTLTEKRQMVLLDMCFNLGITKLCMFQKTLQHMREGNYPGAAYQMSKSAWYKQVGKRAERLCKMMEEG